MPTHMCQPMEDCSRSFVRLMLRDGHEGYSLMISILAVTRLLAIDRLTCSPPLRRLPCASWLHEHEHQNSCRGRQEAQHDHGAAVIVLRVV